MIILFAPSEGKREGGNNLPLSSENLIFPELYFKRIEILMSYQKLVREGSDADLCQLFGIKDVKEFERYKLPFDNAPTMKAIARYDGVAYDYLNYQSLPKEAQNYIDKNTILFSNLFGPIRAGDMIPDYKLKQGSSIDGLVPEKFYKKYFSDVLDAILENQEVLDLRAGFYDKFYIPNYRPVTLKFLKEGKVVSHWAKAYRGIVLKMAAIHQAKSIEEFLSLNIDGLHLHEIIESKKKKEIIYTII